MRALILITLAIAVSGCTRWSMDQHLNSAYRAYDAGNCERVTLELSQVERKSRSRPYVQPEVSMLRGQCLERQKLYVDAAQTYQHYAFGGTPLPQAFDTYSHLLTNQVTTS